jgi:inner membrane protease subunit 2
MQPELNQQNQGNDVVLINRFTVNQSSFHPERGEVVIYRSPTDPQKTCIKRVLAIEGDRIIPRRNDIYYYTDKNEDLFQNDDLKEVTIPRGYCWVEGDNAAHSKDSNSYGAVSRN